MKTQREQRSCAPFSSTWTSGSEAGACWQGEHPDLRIEAMYVGGTRMRTYDYYVLLREEDEEIQHIQHDDQRLGKIQRSTFGSGVDLWKRRKK